MIFDYQELAANYISEHRLSGGVVYFSGTTICHWSPSLSYATAWKHGVVAVESDGSMWMNKYRKGMVAWYACKTPEEVAEAVRVSVICQLRRELHHSSEFLTAILQSCNSVDAVLDSFKDYDYDDFQREIIKKAFLVINGMEKVNG